MLMGAARMTDPETVIHLAGQTITVDGRYVRQRCSWCGEILTDDDLSTLQVAVPEGQSPADAPRGWEAGAWVAISPGVRWIHREGTRAERAEGGSVQDAPYPDESCMAREFPRERRLELVEGGADGGGTDDSGSP